MLTDEQRAALDRLQFHRTCPMPLRYTDSPYRLAMGQGNYCIDGAKLDADVATAAGIALRLFPPGVEPMECWMLSHPDRTSIIVRVDPSLAIANGAIDSKVVATRGYFIPQPKREETPS